MQVDEMWVQEEPSVKAGCPAGARTRGREGQEAAGGTAGYGAQSSGAHPAEGPAEQPVRELEGAGEEETSEGCGLCTVTSGDQGGQEGPSQDAERQVL